VVAGGEHTCAVTTTDKAYCWGTIADPPYSPVAVPGGRRFTQIRAGTAHACGVTPFGGVLCWGNGGTGQLGNGTRGSSATPVRVALDLKARRVVAGGEHTCAVTTTDKAYCWGSNTYGQLGDGTFTERRKPVAVAGGLSFAGVVAGSNHSCGVTTQHKAYCWGDNELGQLGIDVHTLFSTRPMAVIGNRSWKQVIAGFLHTCGVTLTGVGFCWGANAYGQNGDGTATASSQPVRIVGDLVLEGVSTGVQEFSPFGNLGAEHTCGLTTDHRVYCWGNNAYGQIGDGTSSPDVFRRLTPTRVLGPS
jgi:alpha-tubulin suppressor-like RCC1 family protein